MSYTIPPPTPRSPPKHPLFDVVREFYDRKLDQSVDELHSNILKTARLTIPKTTIAVYRSYLRSGWNKPPKNPLL
jgi:hypothetical protein